MGLVNATLQYAISDATPKATQREDGTWEVKDLKVFKAASFKDSRGRRKTWTADELAAMVRNYETLRGEQLLVDVPVREDHSQTMGKVKGYFTGMRSDDKFLYADIEFTEPDGAEKFNRGTYRSRSMEIGSYETNGGQSYWPVATGVAFVDIPAVEGLFSAHRDEESLVKFRIRGVETDNAEDVQTYIKELEEAAGKPATHTFRVGGAEVTDFAAVQARIDELETFQSESIVAGREGAVDAFVKDNKIAAPQADEVKKFVKSLNAEQFAAWKAQYDAAPAMFSANAGDGNGRPNGAPDPALDEIATAQAVVTMHRQGGMREEQVRETDSFRRYVALTGKQPE